MSDSGIIIPLPSLIRIRATGSDRAGFLHNFCTNDIKGLQNSHWCEAFFTSVKARILAHGFLLADQDQHEIWMLPGDEQLLLNHLNRYIITEDVTLESVTSSGSAAAVIGALPAGIDGADNATTGQFTDLRLQPHSVRCLTTIWNEQPVHLIAAGETSADALCESLMALGDPDQMSVGTDADFDRLRIQARVPLIGRDLSEDHLAPEAARSRSAISYTKGCYLGQEPIARLDALGQLRRLLAAVELQEPCAASESVADLTSLNDSQLPAVGLAVVTANSLTDRSTIVRTSDGRFFSATITQPASLSGDEST